MRPDVAVALDVDSAARALRLAEACGDALTWVKVGPVLFVREGPAVVRELRRLGARVFLDLKWHDIPSTVAGAVGAAEALGVELATVHLLAGSASLAAATRARQDGPRLIGVGVLTSHDAAGFAAVVGRAVTDVAAEQERLVRMGREAGLDGLVCASGEAARLRRLWPGAFIVTPGIRRAGEPAGDQRRVATPAEAARAGSDLLVVGRPVTEAAVPADALRAIRAELASAVAA